jgi:NRAMP (natural resistance-associated macrophage protein)-like metal ion transporter
VDGEAARNLADTESRTKALRERFTLPRHSRTRSALGLLGPGIITGAADDDPCAIGTYAKTGAAFGFSLLWIVPLVYPMMSTAVYLCSKIGMVSGMGIAGVVRDHYSRWLLYPMLAALLAVNIIGAGADIGAIAAALHLLLPIPSAILILGVTALILALQIWGSYAMLQKTFKWLALALFAYVGAAVLAKPDLAAVAWGTIRPRFHFNTDYLAIFVAVVGTSLSPYVFFWQASQEVEEEIAIGRHHVWQRRGASDEELTYAAWDVNIGMFFGTLIMYFIVLSTAATLFQTGQTSIDSAYAAAQALRPLAGDAATLLFATGIVGVGILAVPVLTTGPAYALAETFGWNHSLDHPPSYAREFYGIIAVSTIVAMCLNFIGVNPITALFWAGVIEGLLAPVLLVLIMVITNNEEIMGQHKNSLWLNLLGWGTTAVTCLAAVGLIWTWIKK